jgi:hypothetical protein
MTRTGNPIPAEVKIKPRVGGLSSHGAYTIPWIGGSNIKALAMKQPASLLTHQQEDFKNARSTESSLKEGLDEQMWLFPVDDINKAGSGKITLMSWMELICHEIKERGMDTIFLIPDTGSGENLKEESVGWHESEVRGGRKVKCGVA